MRTLRWIFYSENIKSESRELKLEEHHTVVSEGVEFNGNLTSVDDVALHGKVLGNLFCQKTIEIKLKAQVHGDLYAGSVDISGELVGDVYASKVILTSTGSVSGDIVTSNLKISHGALFNGQSYMLKDPSELKKFKRTELRH